MSETTMYPPLTSYFNRLNALIKGDPDMVAELDYDNSLITLTVDDPVKAAAWRTILPEEKTFGEITFNIDVVSSETAISPIAVQVALSSNPNYSRMKHIENEKLGIDRWFCCMNPEVIQFANDNFGSPESLETRTAEDLAREVLSIDGLCFCSEKTID